MAGKRSTCVLDALSGSDKELATGKIIEVHKMPMDAHFKLLGVVLSTERTDYVVTNDLAQRSADGAEEKGAVRWTVARFHREEKQITGIERCQCRRGRSRRNHIGIAVLVGTRLKAPAYQTKKTVYQLKHRPPDEYLTQELNKQSIPFA